MLCLCLALVNLVHSVAPLSSCLVTMALLMPHWVVSSDRFSPNKIATVKITVVKPSHSLDTPSTWSSISKNREHEAMVPGTQSRERSEGAHRNTDRASYHALEQTEYDKRVAMRQGDMSPPVPERVAHPREAVRARVSRPRQFFFHGGKVQRPLSIDVN